jgi:two-component system, sensor histidine kinase and response regulator
MLNSNNTTDFTTSNSDSSSGFSTRRLLLLVEDDKVNQMLGRKMLSKAGYDVEVADNGHMALEMLNNKTYALIITDIKLPLMTGYEMADKIRKNVDAPYTNIPIIAVSAYPSSVEKAKAVNSGISDYISKPFAIHELVEAITNQLNKA